MSGPMGATGARRAPSGRGVRRVDGARERTSAILYVLPLLAGTAAFTLWPIVNVLWLSFQNGYKFLTGVGTGIGIEPYAKVLADPHFHTAVRVTASYTVVVVPASIVIGLFFAWLLNRPLRGRRFFQALYFLPLVTSVIAVGFSWRWIFDHNHGILNHLLGLVGIPRIDWLGDPQWGLVSLMVFGTWALLPLSTVLLLVGMQNLDPRYAQAARVDGARPWAIFRKITLPLLAPTVGLVAVLNTITSSLVFDQLFPLFNGRPGIGGSLYTVVFYIYDTFYNRFDVASASAAAVLFSIVVLLLTLLQLRAQRGWGVRS